MGADVDRLRKHFGTALEILAASALVVGSILYVACKLWPPAAPAGLGAGLALSAPQPLDWYVLRDASGSADPHGYDALESAIRERLCPLAGDRLTRAFFGGRVEPDPMPPPSDLFPPGPPPPVSPALAQTTDFALLFHKLHEAIRDEREARAATRQRHPADAVVVITDGVPDLSHGAAHCPPPGTESTWQSIVPAFKALMDVERYRTHEPVKVRLVLAGAPGECMERIKELWESRLAPLAAGDGFRVLAASRVEQVEAGLFDSLDRNPLQSISLLPLEDGERCKLDRREPFRVELAARSFIRGDLLRFEKAELREASDPPSLGSIQLHVLKDPNFPPSPFEPQNLMTLDLPSPAPGRLVGESKLGSLYFLPAAGQPAEISPYATYDLSLTPAGDHRTAVTSISLRLGPSRAALLSLARQERFRQWMTVAIGFAVVFLVAACGWLATGGARASAGIARLHQFLEQMVVDQVRWWCNIGLLLTPALALGVFFFAAPEVGALVTLGLAILLWTTEKLASQPTHKVFAFAIEFLVLPFFIHFLVTHVR